MDKNFKKMLSDRMGLFVHFGLYSAFAGKYHGKEIEGFGEWIQHRSQIPIAEYENFGRKNFRPSKDFAKDLARTAKAAGFRYIVLTSKHHDGFCLFESSADDYNSMRFFGRDYCRELADACREEGLELGFYYSHTLDWHEKNAAGNYRLSHPDILVKGRNYWDFPDNNIDFDEYFKRKCLPQVRELLTNYGDVKIIWFDYPHDITYEQATELRALVKELQPSCLINSRIGYGLSDYNSLGDNGLPSTPAKLPTECLITLNHTWAYKCYDNDYKTPENIVGILCRTLTADSTLLLNVGPMPNGALTKETYEILAALGEWTGRNAEAIYGDISGNPYKTTFSWGTVAKSKSSVFLYVKEKTDELSLSGVLSAPVSVSLVGDGRPVEFSYSGTTLTVKPPKTDMIMPVLRVDFEGEPKISAELEIDSTRKSLPVAFSSVASRRSPENATPIREELDDTKGNYGKHGMTLTRIETIQNWTSSDTLLLWDVSFTEAGEYTAHVMCAEPSFETNCAAPINEVPMSLSVGDMQNPVAPGTEYSYNLNSSGSCNMRYAKSAGTFNISAPGFYRVALSKEDDTLGYGISSVTFDKLTNP